MSVIWFGRNLSSFLVFWTVSWAKIYILFDKGNTKILKETCGHHFQSLFLFFSLLLSLLLLWICIIFLFYTPFFCVWVFLKHYIICHCTVTYQAHGSQVKYQKKDFLLENTFSAVMSVFAKIHSYLSGLFCFFDRWCAVMILATLTDDSIRQFLFPYLIRNHHIVMCVHRQKQTTWASSEVFFL